MATRTTKKATDIIEDISFESNNQSISRRVIYEYQGKRIKLSLKSDAYKVQCFAHAEVLDGFDWKPLYAIPHSLMRTPKDLRYYPEFQPQHSDFSKASRYFDNDVKTLKEMVTKLI